jgi:hypothetical protein
VAGDGVVDFVEVLRLDEGVGSDGSKLDGVVHRRKGGRRARMLYNSGWAQVIEAERHQLLHSAHAAELTKRLCLGPALVQGSACYLVTRGRRRVADAWR